MILRVAPILALGDGNPYMAFFVRAIDAAGAIVVPYRLRNLWRNEIDVLHLQWPESAAKRPYLYALMRTSKVIVTLIIARLRGTVVVWTVHNLGNHEPRHPRLEQLFLRALAWRVDGWISLSSDAREVSMKTLPGLRRRPDYVIPHGHYRDAYSAPVNRSEARARLGIPQDAYVFLFLGQVRPYKNVPALLEAFAGLQSPRVRLLIAGQDKSGDDTIELLGRRDSRVTMMLRRVADSQIPVLLGAADTCVFPFRAVLNSGSVILSLSMNTPVLVPEKAPFGALRNQVGEEWVRMFQGDLSSADLSDSMNVATPSGTPNLSLMEWAPIGRATLDAYTDLVQSRSR